MICSSLLVQNIIWQIKHWFVTKKKKNLSENEVYLINLTLYLIKWIYKTSTANIILIGKNLDFPFAHEHLLTWLNSMLYCPDQAVRQKKHERWGESGRKGRGMQASKINTGKKKRKKNSYYLQMLRSRKY